MPRTRARLDRARMPVEELDDRAVPNSRRRAELDGAQFAFAN
jgi:hypothetical protein